MSTRKIRKELFQSMLDLEDGKISIKEANAISDKASDEIKSINKEIRNQKIALVKGTVLKPELKLSESDIKIARSIKSKLRKTAETIVEIGEDLEKAIEKKPRGFKNLFYAEIGISGRSAQRYMQIARHVKIQKLKEKNLLQGKTMADLLYIMHPSEDSKKSVDVNKVANGFYSRYKDDSETLENIMEELQKLIENAT